MLVIIVKNHKRKIALACMVVGLWVLMFFTSNVLFYRSLIFNITINDYLTFSYPLRFEVSNIYINDRAKGSVIETGYSFKKPMAYKFKAFTTSDGKFGFLYPSSFILSQKSFEDSDILYHVDFEDKLYNSRGFVQVWDMPYSLKEFLTTSKTNSTLKYKYFKMKSIKVKKIPGYLWDYSFTGSDKKPYKGYEVFFKQGDRMYRISYFVSENQWNKAQEDIFWSMVESIKTY